MFKVEIKKENIVTNSGSFESLELAQAWVQQEELNKSFGMPAHPELDEEGFATEVIIPAEYEVVITDVTAELQVEKEKQEALLYLASTDFYIIREMDSGVQCPIEIKQLRAAARLKV